MRCTHRRRLLTRALANNNFIRYLHLPLVNTSTARRRTASTESGARDGENYATPSGKNLGGTATYISQPDLAHESRRCQGRRDLRKILRKSWATHQQFGGPLSGPKSRIGIPHFITFYPIGYRGGKDRDNGQSLVAIRGEEDGPIICDDWPMIYGRARENVGQPAANLRHPLSRP